MTPLTQVQLVLLHTASDWILLISDGSLPISDQLTQIVCPSTCPMAASRNAANSHTDRPEISDVNGGDLMLAGVL
jgi:hypothetical protein